MSGVFKKWEFWFGVMLVISLGMGVAALVQISELHTNQESNQLELNLKATKVALEKKADKKTCDDILVDLSALKTQLNYGR